MLALSSERQTSRMRRDPGQEEPAVQCPACSTESSDDTTVCPACGADLSAAPEAPTPNPGARRIRIGFGVLMAAIFVAAVVIVVLLPAQPSPVPPGSVVPTASVEPTAAPVDPQRAAVEAAIRGFYATVDAGEPVTTSPYVYRKGSGGVAPAAVDSTGSTVFRIARAVVGSGTADVYGRESRSVIATSGAEVEFRLRLVDEKWLISSWQVARVVPLPSQALSLTDATARDIVGTVLQARQVGDATTMMLLTTDAFQAAHASWFDGADRTTLLTSYRIVSARPKGAAYIVTAEEQWLPEPLTTTYTVVLVGGEILVDGWSWK
jgi:hypothetical protein